MLENVRAWGPYTPLHWCLLGDLQQNDWVFDILITTFIIYNRGFSWLSLQSLTWQLDVETWLQPKMGHMAQHMFEMSPVKVIADDVKHAISRVLKASSKIIHETWAVFRKSPQQAVGLS